VGTPEVPDTLVSVLETHEGKRCGYDLSPLTIKSELFDGLKGQQGHASCEFWVFWKKRSILGHTGSTRHISDCSCNSFCEEMRVWLLTSDNFFLRFWQFKGSTRSQNFVLFCYFGRKILNSKWRPSWKKCPELQILTIFIQSTTWNNPKRIPNTIGYDNF